MFFTENSLKKSYKILFNFSLNNNNVYKDLYLLKVSDIKIAYRKKSKLVHPDSYLKRKNESLPYDFNDLNIAYKMLIDYKQKTNSYIKKYSNTINTDKNMVLPNRKLKFGEFLYHLKKVSWDNLLNIIVCQQNARDKIGNIGVEFMYLRKNDILSIIKNKSVGEKFGETAVRLKYFTNRQLDLLLFAQKKRVIPIGKYFVNMNYINTDELNIFLKLHKKHNEKIIN